MKPGVFWETIRVQNLHRGLGTRGNHSAVASDGLTLGIPLQHLPVTWRTSTNASNDRALGIIGF